MTTLYWKTIETFKSVYQNGNLRLQIKLCLIIIKNFALLLFMISVFSIPMLLDREVDFVTAMITSFQTVTENPVPMLIWAAFIAVSTFLALIPAFLGLFLVLPLLGHATWHLYSLLQHAAED